MIPVLVLVLAAGAFAALLRWAHGAPEPATLGLHQGALAPCPATPNCVATEGAPAGRRLEPLPYLGDPAATREALRAVILAMPRTRIERETGDYLHATFRTPVIGFIDDVEFRFDDAARVVHFRSASRLGRSDLGVNRRRMETLRARYLSRGNAPSGPR